MRCFFVRLIFASVFVGSERRSLTPHEVEAHLQAWKAGKEARIWITVQVAESLCPGLTAGCLNAYAKAAPAGIALDRGFDFRVERRQATHIYIFDQDALDYHSSKTIDFPYWR